MMYKKDLDRSGSLSSSRGWSTEAVLMTAALVVVVILESVFVFQRFPGNTTTLITKPDPIAISISSTTPTGHQAGSSTVATTTGTGAIPVDLPYVLLQVPFVAETPDGVWTGPWKNGCEEASMTMVEKYYQGDTSVSVADAKSFMQMIFAVEDGLYGSDANSDAGRTAYLVNTLTSYHARVVTDPTIDQIKAEIAAGRPVITFHYGFALGNKDIPFLASGSSYHAMVVIGYDELKKQFMVNDDGDITKGAGHVYGYSLFMNSLHDYDYSDNKADGPARVLFTSQTR